MKPINLYNPPEAELVREMLEISRTLKDMGTSEESKKPIQDIAIKAHDDAMQKIMGSEHGFVQEQ